MKPLWNILNLSQDWMDMLLETQVLIVGDERYKSWRWTEEKKPYSIQTELRDLIVNLKLLSFPQKGPRSNHMSVPKSTVASRP